MARIIIPNGLDSLSLSIPPGFCTAFSRQPVLFWIQRLGFCFGHTLLESSHGSIVNHCFKGNTSSISSLAVSWCCFGEVTLAKFNFVSDDSWRNPLSFFELANSVGGSGSLKPSQDASQTMEQHFDLSALEKSFGGCDPAVPCQEWLHLGVLLNPLCFMTCAEVMKSLFAPTFF